MTDSGAKKIAQVEPWMKAAAEEQFRKFGGFSSIAMSPEALTQIIAEHAPGVAPQNQWISVKERLPDDDCDYLVWVVNDEWYAKHPDIMSFVMSFETGKREWGPHRPIRKASNVITYWQPLPAAPKEGEK